MIPLSKNILSKFPLRTLIWGTYTMCSFLEAFQFRTIKSYIPFFSPNPLLGNCATHQLAKYSHPFTINIYNFRFTYRFSKNILLSQHVYHSFCHSCIMYLIGHGYLHDCVDTNSFNFRATRTIEFDW